MRIFLLFIVSMLLFLFVFVGAPAYVNFYGGDASPAFLRMLRAVILSIRVIASFLFAQLIVSAFCRLMMTAGSKGGWFLLLKRLINLGGVCIYGFLIVYCAISNVMDFMIHGSAAYKNFPISLGVSIYLGLSLEVARSLMLAFRNTVVRDATSTCEKSFASQVVRGGMRNKRGQGSFVRTRRKKDEF